MDPNSQAPAPQQNDVPAGAPPPDPVPQQAPQIIEPTSAPDVPAPEVISPDTPTTTPDVSTLEAPSFDVPAPEAPIAEPAAPVSEPAPSEPTPAVSEPAGVEPAAPVPAAADPLAPVAPQEPVLFAPDAPVTPATDTPQPTGPGYISPAPTVMSHPVSFNSQKKSKKPLAMIAGGALVVALLAGGTVFGYVLPNRPENVWNTGLSRSGKALEKLVSTATEKSTIDKFSKSEVGATLSAKMGEDSYSGSLASRYDETGGNAKLEVKGKDASGKDLTISLDAIAEIVKDSPYPTAHLRFNGVEDLGLDYFVPGISDFQNKWITLDQDYFKSLGLEEPEAQKSSATASDIAEIANTAIDVTNEYVFTTDPKKAILERKSIVGKESVDGITAFHYKVTANEAHGKDYCNAMIDKITALEAWKKLPFYNKDTFEEDKKSYHKDCDESADSEDNTEEEADLWIDAKYKLVYKIRVTDKDDKESYVEIGQRYKGGDDVSLFSNIHEKDSVGTVAFKTNLKNSQTSMDLNFDGKSTNNPYNFKMTLTAKPYTGTIDTKAPDGAIKLQDVMTQLGIDPGLLMGGGNSFETSLDEDGSATTTSSNLSSTDVLAKTRLNSTYAKLEEYYNNNGYYPTLTNLANSAWRKTNMPGLDIPDNTKISSSAGAGGFSYLTTTCDAKGCQKYSLSTDLSSGAYTKTSLN